MNTPPPAFSEQLELLHLFCADLPASLRELVLERYNVGYAQYGDAWVTRDNLAEAAPEIADAVVYIFQAVLAEQVRSKHTQRVRRAISDAWSHFLALCVGARKTTCAGDERV